MDLSQFQTTNDDGETIQLTRPETKTEADLARVIALNKPQAVIDKFAELVVLGNDWDWFEAYCEAEKERIAIETFNSDLPVIGEDGNGDNIYAEPKIIPPAPMRVTKSPDDFLPDQNTALDQVLAGIEAGELRAVIDRVYPLQEMVTVHKYVELRTKVGHVVVQVSE